MSRFFLLFVKVKRLLDFMSWLTKSSVMVTPLNVKAYVMVIYHNKCDVPKWMSGDPTPHH